MRVSRLLGQCLFGMCVGVLFPSVAPAAASCTEARILYHEYRELGPHQVNSTLAFDALSSCLTDKNVPRARYSKAQLPDLLLLADVSLLRAIETGNTDDFLSAEKWIRVLQNAAGENATGADAYSQGRALILWARWLDAASTEEFTAALAGGVPQERLCGDLQQPSGATCKSHFLDTIETVLAQAKTRFAGSDETSMRWQLETDFWGGWFKSKNTETSVIGRQQVKKVIQDAQWPNPPAWAIPVVAQALEDLARSASPFEGCSLREDVQVRESLSCSELSLMWAQRINPAEDPGLLRDLQGKLKFDQARKQVEESKAETEDAQQEALRFEAGLKYLKTQLEQLDRLMTNSALDLGMLAHQYVRTANPVAILMLAGSDQDYAIIAKVFAFRDTQNRSEAYAWIEEHLDRSPASPYEDAELRRISALALATVLQAETESRAAQKQRLLEKAGFWLDQLRDPSDPEYQSDFIENRVNVSAPPLVVLGATRARYFQALSAFTAKTQDRVAFHQAAVHAQEGVLYWLEYERKRGSTTLTTKRWITSQRLNSPGLKQLRLPW